MCMRLHRSDLNSSAKFRQNFSKVGKCCKNCRKMRKSLTIFFWNIEVWAVQRHVNLVDLVKSFPTNIFLQKSASIQPRTSHLIFILLAASRDLIFTERSSPYLRRSRRERPHATVFLKIGKIYSGATRYSASNQQAPGLVAVSMLASMNAFIFLLASVLVS